METVVLQYLSLDTLNKILNQLTYQLENNNNMHPNHISKVRDSIALLRALIIAKLT